MSRSRIEVGDKLQCIEQITKHPGLLIVEHDRVWVEFVGFGRKPTVDVQQPIVLHTTKGFVVTLVNNIEINPVIPSWRKGDVDPVYIQRFISNFPIYGQTTWDSDDVVSAVYFSVTPDFPFLWAKDRASIISGTPTNRIPDTSILEIDTDAGSIRLNFACEGDRFEDRWTVTTPYFGIHFASGRKPEEALRSVGHLTDLFTLLTWQSVEATDIIFERRGNDRGKYEFRLLGAVAPKSETPSRSSLVPLGVNNERERSCFSAIIDKWMALQSKWAGAVLLMVRSQQTFRSYSMERALDACRWHEALQRAKGPVSAPPRMCEVIAAAKAKAIECGLNDYVDLVGSTLNGIHGEPRRELFSKIIDEVNSRFRAEVFRPQIAITMLMGAYRARNQTGHGSSRALSSTETRGLMGDILAMEATCLAQMTAELPLSDQGFRLLLDHHPLLAGFRTLQQERATKLRRLT